MNVERSISVRGLVAFTTIALSVSGCKCTDAPVTRTYGDILVIWRDATGERISNRDATYNFDLGLMGTRTEKTMTLRNAGSGVLTLAKLERTDGDDVVVGSPGQVVPTTNSSFEVEFETLTILPSEQREFNIAFTPKGLKGDYLTKLLLTTEGTPADQSTAVISLVGRGERGACDLPDKIDFGSTPIGATLSSTLPFLNPTGLDVSGNAGPITGTNATSFGYQDGSPMGAVPVAPNSNVNVVFTFSPTEEKPYEAQVTLKGPGNCPEKTVALVGVGSNEGLTWSPTNLDFEKVNPGEPKVMEVIFKNPASVPVVLTQVTSTNQADFYHSVPAGSDETQFTVPGGLVPTPMKIACKPSKLGALTGTLTFVTGQPQAPSGTITLVCTGGGPRIRVSPRPTLSFGRVGFFPGNTTFSIQRKVNVQNVGSRSGAGDTSANLFLGQVAGDGTVGQFPFFELVAGPGTEPDEFTVALGTAYVPTTGIEPVAGKNFVDLLVTLKPLSPGPKTATLSIHSNDSNEQTVVVEITADAQQPPPCNFTTSPAEGNFGLVAPGAQKDLAITITNNSVTAGETCIFSGIELGAGSDLAFSIVGGNIVEKELQPQQSFEVVVRAAPTGATPTVLQTLNGRLVFNSTSAAKPQASIPLKASVGPTCITVTPDPLNFGTLKIGCNSSERSLNIYNTCSTPVTIKKFQVQAAAGQPAGGPNCAGSTACPEFFLGATPTIPGGGLPLSPGGSAPVSFKAKYRPIDVGSDSGAIAIDAIQNGQSITYLVGLKGNGDNTGLQVDTYAQEFKPKADILLVVDDSCSMQDKQAALASNFNSFITYAKSAQVDYQIGVTTTTNVACNPFTCGGSSKGPFGQMVLDAPTNLKFVTPTTPALADVFGRLVKVGIDGSGLEEPLATAVLALTPPLIANENAGFLRPEANLAVVVVSDASDQSPEPVTYYQNLLVNVKGFQRLSSFTFNVIGPTKSFPPLSCTYDDNGANSSRYAPIVSFTSGVSDEICNADWAQALRKLGETAFGYRTQFFLNGTPDLTKQAIVVRVNGIVKASGPNSWEYDAATNSVKFNPIAVPAPGDPLEIEYIQACL